MRSVYFALKFFYENVLNGEFDEKLPVVLNRSEIQKMFEGLSGDIKKLANLL